MIRERLARRTPFFFAVITFSGGVLLLISGATPSVPERLKLAYDLLPDPLVELSHFLGSVVGTGLLILAWGLRRRLRDAYLLSVALLGGGSVLLLLKGLEYGPALILLSLLLILRLARRQFDREASLMNEPFTRGWGIAISLALAGSIWLLKFSFGNLTYSHDLWWQVALGHDASRSFRATLGAVMTVVVFSFLRLFRTISPEPAATTEADRASIQAIVARHQQAEAHLAFLGDKHFFFNADRSAFIMFGISGNCWVAMGDPVGPVRESQALIRSFTTHCRKFERMPVFYQVSDRLLGPYLDAGLAVVKIGEAGRVPLDGFTAAGKTWEDARYRHRRCQRAGCTLEVLPAELVPGHLPEFRAISDAWLSQKRGREFWFSLGGFLPEYVSRLPTAIVRREGRIIAFASLWQAGGHEEVEADLARYAADAPQWLMYFIMLELMHRSAAQGYRWFNLGMAPLAGLESTAASGFLHRLGGAIFQWGEPLYQFQGLRQFKNKFNPVWTSRYLASPGGLRLPTILASIAALVRIRHPVPQLR